MTGLGSAIRIAPVRRLGLTPALRRSLDLLRMDASGILQMIAEEAAENPSLQIAWRRPVPPQRPDNGMADAEAPGPGLFAHVLSWIESAVPPGDDRRIALALAEVLEPSGWLGEAPVTVAAMLGLPVSRVDAVLARLQAMEPAGLFARDLADCLRLQARDAGLLDAAMQAVLARLDLLAAKGPAAVARAAKMNPQAIETATRHLRGFDPKPGALFSASSAPVAVPDLIAAPATKGGWQVRLNPSSVPVLSVRTGRGAETPLADAATALVGMLARRNRALLAIAQAVLLHQAPAAQAGLAGLVPLTRAMVAQDVGLAPSTVSRALQGARIATPHGTWPMAALFPSALPQGASSAKAEGALRRLVQAEDKAAPLSDAALAARLAEQGIPASRRTVAKYRHRLGLAPAHRRRIHGSD